LGNKAGYDDGGGGDNDEMDNGPCVDFFSGGSVGKELGM
jgi:hypothetical protein